MDPEVTPEGTNPQPETPPEAPKPPTEIMVPQSKVDEIVAKEKRKMEARVRKELEAELKAPEKKPEPKAPEQNSEVADLRADLAFRDSMEELSWKPTKKQKEALRVVYSAKGEEAMMELADLLAPTTAPVIQAKAEEKPAPAPTQPQIKTPGAAVGVPVNSMDIPPGQMTKTDVERMQADNTLLDWGEKNGRGSTSHPFSRKRARALRGMPK